MDRQKKVKSLIFFLPKSVRLLEDFPVFIQYTEFSVFPLNWLKSQYTTNHLL